MGGQFGNQNNQQGKGSADHTTYMRNYRKERAGRVKFRTVGRPRRMIQKGDIFDVAARLAAALRHLLADPDIANGNYIVDCSSANAALQMWHDYWEQP